MAWGDNVDGQCNVPAPNTGFVAVSAGYWHSLGLKANGTIVAWGANWNGQCNVPSPNADFVAVSAGWFGHCLGLKSDGSIVAWGRGMWDYGQCDVPEPNTDFVAVEAGKSQSLGLKADGSIVAWGDNGNGAWIVPEPNNDFVAVAARGNYYSLGLTRASNGACCHIDGTCTFTDQEGCEPPNIYLGDGTRCLPNVCPTSAVDETSQNVALLTLSVAPSPSFGEVSILYRLPVATAISLEIFNAAGALVRRLAEGQRPAGAFSTPWDGRDDNGREMPTGVYFARIVTGQGSTTGRVVLAR